MKQSMPFRTAMMIGLSLLGFHFSILTFAQIREITRMQEIAPNITQDTLIVFDIDNTLVAPQGYLGSDEWFYYLINLYETRGLKNIDAEKKAENIWNKSQRLIQVMPVEKETPEWLRTQKSRGIKMIALTARSEKIAEETFQQLNSVGISFRETSISPQKVKLPRKDFNSMDDVFFDQGVAFIGETNQKGKTLEALLKKLEFFPKKLIFVDDKLKHVKSVDLILSQMKIPHICFRYGALDLKVEVYKALMNELKVPKKVDLFFKGNWAD